MKRVASVLLSILIGALAAGIGLAIFLKKANDDRTRLAEIVEQEQQKSKEAVDTSNRTVEEANQKLQAANNEITKAQDVIKALQDERTLIAQATDLPTPTTKTLKGWKEAINPDLGVSLKFPPTQSLETNDLGTLTLSGPTSTSIPDARWLSITLYNATSEQDVLVSFVSSTPVTYFIQGHVLTGRVGTLASGAENIYELHIQQNGVITHQIWAREPDKNGHTLQTVFSTLTFAH